MNGLPPEKGRVARLKKLLKKTGADGFVTFNLKDIRYLTGFSGTSGGVVIAGGKPLFLTDFRYKDQAAAEVSSMPVAIVASLFDGAAEHIKAGDGKRIIFDPAELSVEQLSALKKKSGKRSWVPAKPVSELRMIKDEAEMKVIRKNFRILSKVFHKIPELLKPGMKEKELAARLEYELRMAGGDGKAFDFIVASGARSALPHGVASSKKIPKRAHITIDWGCMLDGYHTDNTRNFMLGKPDMRLFDIHQIVLEANRRALDMVKPGVPLKEIEGAARDYITEQGYGKEFGHGTGHGVGLDIHEAPTVSPRSAQKAKVGMVFTIEPGIYIPGLGGARVEDMILVTKNGYELLSKSIPQEITLL